MTRWVDVARKYLGVREIPGKSHNPVILGFWKLAKLAGIKNDEIPWCSGFACAVFEEVGIRSPRSDGAKNWLTWGLPLHLPVYGCVVVFKRPGGYHVGIVIGVNSQGTLQVLGGNQDNAVTVASFGMDRVEGFRFPAGEPVPQGLPVIAGAVSTRSEA